jgi:hypothetical protein
MITNSYIDVVICSQNRHAGSLIKLRTDSIRHPVADLSEKNGFPFDQAQDTEPLRVVSVSNHGASPG